MVYFYVRNLLVLDRNTWNHTSVCELFALDRDTRYRITECKQMMTDKYKSSVQNTKEHKT